MKLGTQIEQKLLAEGFGYMGFHYYFYGREFKCKSDYKSLENIQCEVSQ